MKNIIMTGFQELDYLLKGFRDSELIFVGARPSMGKTTFMLNIARNTILAQNIPTLFFSLEMSREQLLDCIKRMGGAPTSNLIIDDTPALSVDALAAKTRKYIEENNIGLIIIDYLQLLCDDEYRELSDKNIYSRKIETSYIIQKLKKLACELSVPIVTTSQHPRMAERREDHRPKLSDLRKIGDIEQYIDTAIFLYRDDYYNKDTEFKGITEIIVAKQDRRNVGTVELAFVNHLGLFLDIERKYLNIEVTGSNKGANDGRQGKKYFYYEDFEKDILKMFLMHKYDLVDIGFCEGKGHRIRTYVFSKKIKEIWRKYPVFIIKRENDINELNILYEDNIYNSYEDVLEKIEYDLKNRGD